MRTSGAFRMRAQLADDEGNHFDNLADCRARLRRRRPANRANLERLSRNALALIEQAEVTLACARRSHSEVGMGLDELRSQVRRLAQDTGALATAELKVQPEMNAFCRAMQPRGTRGC